jgi:hypothetical protein
MITAGSLSSKAQFKTRSAAPDTPGALRQGFNNSLRTNASFNDSGRMTPVILGDITMSGRSGTLIIRESLSNSGVATVNHRVNVDDDNEFEITGVEYPGDGTIKLSVQTAPSRETFSRECEQKGEVVTVRRVNPTGPATEATARALVSGYLAEELVGGINQGDRKITLAVEDLERKGFPLPLKSGSTDSLIIRGRKMTITEIDDSTFRVAGQLIALRMRVTG